MPGTKLTSSTSRIDPYKNFKFRLKLDGVYVAAVSTVSSLTRTTEVVKHREDADPSLARSMPGQSKYEAITLEGGVTHDTAFHQWADKVWDYKNFTTNGPQGGAASNAEVSDDFRKDLAIEVYNEAGQHVQTYNIYRCWVSEYQALPDLDSAANAVAIQHLKLENEGWNLV